jgi:hypothetical protein
MKVLMENFSENIRDQIPENFQGEGYTYNIKEQEKNENELKKLVIDKQKGLWNE